MIAVASLSSALFATQALGENVSSSDSLADSTAPVGLKEIKLQGFLPLDDGKKAPPLFTDVPRCPFCLPGASECCVRVRSSSMSSPLLSKERFPFSTTTQPLSTQPADAHVPHGLIR